MSLPFQIHHGGGLHETPLPDFEAGPGFPDGIFTPGRIARLAHCSPLTAYSRVLCPLESIEVIFGRLTRGSSSFKYTISEFIRTTVRSIFCFLISNFVSSSIYHIKSDGAAGLSSRHDILWRYCTARLTIYKSSANTNQLSQTFWTIQNLLGAAKVLYLHQGNPWVVTEALTWLIDLKHSKWLVTSQNVKSSESAFLWRAVPSFPPKEPAQGFLPYERRY